MQRKVITFIGAACIGALAVIHSLRAQDAKPVAGTGVICDTADQMAEVVAGKPIKEINTAAGDVACAPLTIAFHRGPSERRVTNAAGEVFEITPILVVAVFVEHEWKQTEQPARQFIAVKVADAPNQEEI